MMERRTFLRSGLTAGGLAATGVLPLTELTSQSASAQETATDARLSLVQPLASDRLLDRVGVNTHLSFRTSVYASDGAVLELLSGLGVRRVRDRLACSLPAQHDAFRRLREAGIKVHSTAQLLGDSRADLKVFMSTAKKLGGRDMFCSFGGVNEPNLTDGWLPLTLRHQRMIKGARDAAGLGDIPISGPSLHDRLPSTDHDYRALARSGISRYTDAGDIHCYPDGRGGNDRLLGRRRQAAEVYGKQPVWCTETGYNTGMRIRTAGNSVPSRVQAAYLPRLILSHFVRGSTVFLYQLLDDPHRSDYGSHWGLVECPSLRPRTWTPKPSYAAVAQLLRGASDPGPRFTPRPVRLEVDRPDEVQTLVLGKRDGGVTLYLWRDVELWDPGTREPVRVGSVRVTVRDARGRRTVRVAGDLVTVRIRR